MNPRPLVVRFGALGDMVMLTVAIRHLHARFGQPVDIIGVGRLDAPLLQGSRGSARYYRSPAASDPIWLSLAAASAGRASCAARAPVPTWLFDHDNRKICALLMRAGWTPAHWCHHEDMPRARRARTSAIAGCASPIAIRRCWVAQDLPVTATMPLAS